MNKLVSDIKENSNKYGSIPFWSLNEKLQKNELRRQINDIADLKMSGFFMHARTGLETEYLSDDWFECMAACVDEAKKLGLEAWSYDENGWPSGFAGGKLLEDEDNLAVFVEGEFFDTYPPTDKNTLAVYGFDKCGRPYVADKDTVSDKFLRINMGVDDSYVDTMRADVTDKFIEATHEIYKERLSEDFGGAMPGFFTDEPQYYRWKTPYSKMMDIWFMEEYGYSVIEALPSLFCDYEGAEKKRYDYHKMTSSKFTENFSKKLYDWHEENGALLTGHFVEEESLSGQMMCCGDIMPQYQYEHIPGVDYLTRKRRGDLIAKQLGSVCAQLGRKKAMSEMFACCGWNVTPSQLKSIAELQYSGGVNLMCQHLYPYSIRGQRKRDYPTFYSEHNVWHNDLKDFNEYFNNLGYTLSMGQEIADTLVIHPIHSAWLYFKRIDMKASVADLDKDLRALTDLLSGSQVAYHLGSETMMQDLAKVDGNVISVGLCKYKQVIIPAMDTIDSSTLALLETFKKNGGKIYTFKHHVPTRVDGRPFEITLFDGCDDISDDAVLVNIKQSGEVTVDGDFTQEIRSMVRRTDYGRITYVTNLSDRDIYNIKIRVRNCKGVKNIDIQTLELSLVRGRNNGEDTDILIDLKGYESVLIVECDSSEFLEYKENGGINTVKLDGACVRRIIENCMTLDRASVSFDGKTFGELLPLERIKDEMFAMRYEGVLTLRFPFSVKDIPPTLKVVTEPFAGEYIYVNGVKVKVSDEWKIDRCFRSTEISQYLHSGENFVDLSFDYYQSEYVYHVLFDGVSETLRNCLAFDTEIENIYLFGDFCIDTDISGFVAAENNAFRYNADKGMTLVKSKETADIANIVTDGYPFYCGSITVDAEISYKNGDPTLLCLDGCYCVAHVKVNGEFAGKILFGKYLELKGHLVNGKNKVEITLFNSYRNLMGPHHYCEAEPISVFPKQFSFEGEWKNGKCDIFNKGYSFVRFGLDV